MATPEFRFPTVSQRTAIIGRTGSGKTQAGVWFLSRAHFDRQPYVVVDYKRDNLIGGIDRAQEIGLKEIPKQPGLYVIRPNPADEEQVENWLWKVWQREKIGLYIDEGYMLPMGAKGAFTSILTQGRSKQIPVICLSQRPVFLSRFVFSEADYFGVFQLNDSEDAKTVQRYIPRDRLDIRQELPDFNFYWFDVAKRTPFHMTPVPDETALLQHFEDRLKPTRKHV